MTSYERKWNEKSFKFKYCMYFVAQYAHILVLLHHTCSKQSTSPNSGSGSVVMPSLFTQRYKKITKTDEEEVWSLWDCHNCEALIPVTHLLTVSIYRACFVCSLYCKQLLPLLAQASGMGKWKTVGEGSCSSYMVTCNCSSHSAWIGS